MGTYNKGLPRTFYMTRTLQRKEKKRKEKVKRKRNVSKENNENNEDYESQFEGSPLGEMLGQQYQTLKSFYREYPTNDYGFQYIREPERDGYSMALTISEEVAKALIAASPYGDRLPSLYRCELVNKGALRITHEDEEISELWVYNHDGSYFLLMPPEKEH